MLLPWPTTDNEAVLYQALDIAMGYLERTGQAVDHDAVEAMVASAVLRSYGQGVRHPIRIANDAIKALRVRLFRRTLRNHGRSIRALSLKNNRSSVGFTAVAMFHK